MEKNKIVAQHEATFIKGVPTVRRFYDSLNLKNIDILKCIDSPQSGVQVCATIGLNDVDIGLISRGKDLRTEIIGASDILIDNFENMIATAAFEIMDSKKCFPGYIIENVVSEYLHDSDMKHILLTDPFLWECAECIEIDNMYIAWLMIVPISQRECEYAYNNGADALELSFEKADIDVYNLYRKSII